MKITKKFDRAFQWAGERMGSEAKTAHSEEFKMLETEMALRIDGMERMQKSMNAYVKHVTDKGQAFGSDKEKGMPAMYLGRTMASHGEDFEQDSEFGNCLIAMGRTNEALARMQEQYAAEITSTWLESLNRSMAMMKEYQAARKKLESRRLAYDASVSKNQKAKRDDYRLDEELRTARAKFEESNEDVLRRMQDIKENELDSVRDLTGFLDAQLDFHQRCVEELRRTRESWAAPRGSPPPRIPPTRPSRSNTSYSYSERSSRNNLYYEEEPEPEPVRMPIRSSRPPPSPPSRDSRPPLGARATSLQGYADSTNSGRRVSSQSMGQTQPLGNVMRSQLRPTNRINTDISSRDDVFADHDDETPQSRSESPEWGDRCASPATSLGSWSRSTTGSTTMRKAAPPPPPCRSKKPPPPIPPKRGDVY